MNDYIVEHETIQKILNGIERMGYMECLMRYVPEGKSAGQALLDLNVFSINELYGEGAADYFEVPLTFEPVNGLLPQSNLGLYKTLTCYLRQSGEGRARDTELYKFLEKIQGWVAYNIISILPGYDVLEWG